jgi:hypothetical protein
MPIDRVDFASTLANGRVSADIEHWQDAGIGPVARVWTGLRSNGYPHVSEMYFTPADLRDLAVWLAALADKLEGKPVNPKRKLKAWAVPRSGV